MNIIQMIIDFITYTPTFYVDGIPCEVDCAWIGAVIGLVGAGVSAAMSASAASGSASRTRRAARKNYNMLMENAEMSKMTLNEQMDRYIEDMDSYRSSMIQRYGLAGGIDPNTAQLNEVRNYNFGVDTMSLDVGTLKKEYDEKWRKENADKDKWVNERLEAAEKEYNSKLSNSQIERNEFFSSYDRIRTRKKLSKEYDKLYKAPSKQMSDEDWTNELGRRLKDNIDGYQGKQTPWDKQGSFFKSSRKGTGPAESSAILNLRTSVSNMQRDINNAYKAGMIDYWQQRKNAQNVKDTGMAQAAGYSTQAQTTLANGFISAIQYGAQAYTQYKSGR